MGRSMGDLVLGIPPNIEQIMRFGGWRGDVGAITAVSDKPIFPLHDWLGSVELMEADFRLTCWQVDLFQWVLLDFWSLGILGGGCHGTRNAHDWNILNIRKGRHSQTREGLVGASARVFCSWYRGDSFVNMHFVCPEIAFWWVKWWSTIGLYWISLDPLWKTPRATGWPRRKESCWSPANPWVSLWFPPQFDMAYMALSENEATATPKCD